MAKMTRQELTLMVQKKGLESLLNESKAFRKFIFTLFAETNIFYPTYSRASSLDTAYQEGRRSVGLEVLHMLKGVRPDILGLIEAEGNLLAEDIAAVTPTDEDADADLPNPIDE